MPCSALATETQTRLVDPAAARNPRPQSEALVCRLGIVARGLAELPLPALTAEHVQLSESIGSSPPVIVGVLVRARSTATRGAPVLGDLPTR
jgi:hypothetical protein